MDRSANRRALRLARRSYGLLLAAALIVGGATAAHAKNEYLYWNSSSNQLSVSGYSSTGYAYGQWRVTDGSNGTRAYGDAKVRISNALNHKVFAKFYTYVNAGYCATTPYLSCTQQYFYYADADSSHTASTTAVWVYANTAVPGTANYARAGVEVKLDIPNHVDPASGQSYTNGTRY